MTPDWTGKTAVVLASGPSLTLQQCVAAVASGQPTIAVNATFELAHRAAFRVWRDALVRSLTPSLPLVYMGDMLAIKHYASGVKQRGMRAWTQDANAAERYGWGRVKGVNKEGVGRQFIHLNGNSGFQALNLAFIFGARRILLAGFDMRLGPLGQKHWHPDHPRPMVQYQCFEEWARKSVKIARDLAAFGCEVVNCTPGSALTCWPMGDLETELAKCHPLLS